MALPVGAVHAVASDPTLPALIVVSAGLSPEWVGPKRNAGQSAAKTADAVAMVETTATSAVRQDEDTRLALPGPIPRVRDFVATPTSPQLLKRRISLRLAAGHRRLEVPATGGTSTEVPATMRRSGARSRCYRIDAGPVETSPCRSARIVAAARFVRPNFR